MLTLHYDNERARIDNNGCVEYHEDTISGMIMTDAPSQTIMQLVQAAIPIIAPKTIEAKIGITRIEKELRDVMAKVKLAENDECIAREARRKQLDKKSDLLAQLRIAESALQVLQQEKSC